MAALKPTPQDGALRTHGIIAAMSIALAALAYCAPNLFDRHGAPLLFDGGLLSIEEVRYTLDDSQIKLVCARGHVTEVQVQTGTSHAPGQRHQARYRPSPDADALLARVAPLRSLRSLGQQDDAHLQLFGLADAHAARLHIHAGAQSLEVVLGRPLYGTQDVYGRADPFGVVVLPSNLMRAFDHGAAALWDAHILGPKNATTEKFLVHRLGKTCAFARLTQEPNGGFFAVSNKAPNTRPSPAPLVDQVLDQLQTITFVGAADAAQVVLTAAPPDLAFELFDDALGQEPQATLRMHSGHDVAVLVGNHPLEPVVLGQTAASALKDAAQALCGQP